MASPRSPDAQPHTEWPTRRRNPLRPAPELQKLRAINQQQVSVLQARLVEACDVQRPICHQLPGASTQASRHPSSTCLEPE